MLIGSEKDQASYLPKHGTFGLTVSCFWLRQEAHEVTLSVCVCLSFRDNVDFFTQYSVEAENTSSCNVDKTISTRFFL